MAQSNVLPDTLLPIVLSGQLAQVVESGVPHDVLIEGIPFRVKPTDENPLLHQLLDEQKDQFDTSREAGENSFGSWWLRSQSTFHGGQGQKYLDSGDPEPARQRFFSSKYAYPHVPGELTIAGKVTTAASSKNKCEQVTWASTQKLVTASSTTNEIRTYTLPGLTGETTITLGASGTPTDMTTDGVNVYVAIADKIYRVNSSGVATHTHSITFSGPVVLGFAKQRLILCIGNKIYELDPNPAAPPVVVNPATPFYTNPSTDYRYTSVSAGPNGIYVSGYSGTQSDISLMAIRESGSSLTLGPPVIQLTFPPTELVNSVFFYVNSLFAVATSSGVRIGAFTPYGQPQIGPLSITGVACYSLTASGTLVWVGAKDCIYWVDLATPIDDVGTYASAMYTDGVGASGTDTVSDIVVFTSTKDLVFGTTAAGNLISQTAWEPATSATLTTSWVRFGTTEKKRLHYIAVEGDLPAVGGVDNVLSVTVETIDGDTKAFNVAGGGTNFEFSCEGLSTSQAFRLVFTLRDITSDHGVVLRSWQMKALPTPPRYPEVVLPLMLNDLERSTTGQPVGYLGFAKDRLLALLALGRLSTQLTVVDRLLGVSYQALIDRVQFQQTTAPTPTNPLGGIVNVVLRLV